MSNTCRWKNKQLVGKYEFLNFNSVCNYACKWSKASGGFQAQYFNHWAMMIFNQLGRNRQFHKTFNSPSCDVAS